MKNERLVTTLIAIQAIQRWTTAELAAELGVSPRLIPMLYRGKRGIGVKFLGAIGRRFPALQGEIWDALVAPDEKEKKVCGT